MSFLPKTICILGRQPALGLAELESLYGASQVMPFGDNAVLELDPSGIDFQRLGGTIKVTKVLATDIGSSWSAVEKYLLKNIPDHLEHLPEGKFTLGLSCYGLPVNVNDINKTGLKIKKIIKATGRPARVVPNKTTELSSAQVLHNGLTRLGGWELNAVSDGKTTILTQTIFVQDINAYAARDQVRPARDARVGMLPPKLAQIIVNLAVGPLKGRGLRVEDRDKSSLSPKPSPPVVLDPFCGTGVVLQEALLMGCNVIGTDLEPRMIEYSQKNIDWLSKTHKNYSDFLRYLEVADATSHKWRDISFDSVACETYLGRPLNSLPGTNALNEIVQDVNTIIAKFLKNLASQAKPGTRMCLALPAWNLGSGNFKHLPLIDAFDSQNTRSASTLSERSRGSEVERVAKLTDMGYNVVKFEHVREQDLIYYRENQVVARQLIVIEKK